MSNLEELKQKYDELGKEIEKMEKGSTGRWKPEEAKGYWFLDSFGGAIGTNWINNFRAYRDNWRYINNNVFKTKEEAQKYRNYILARAEHIYEFANEEWENEGIKKYCIYYDYEDKELIIENVYFTKKIGQLDFKTEEQAQEFINKYEKQILKYEFNIEEE